MHTRLRTACTLVAPRCSRQSVNPPVEAPTSRHVKPIGLMSKVSKAPSILSPPLPTYLGFSLMLKSASELNLVLGLASTTVPVLTSPARMSRLACSRESQSPLVTRRASTRSFAGISARLAHYAEIRKPNRGIKKPPDPREPDGIGDLIWLSYSAGVAGASAAAGASVATGASAAAGASGVAAAGAA